MKLGKEVIQLLLLSFSLAVVVWLALGIRGEVYYCPPKEALGEGEVCIESVREEEGVLWVDARVRSDFEKATAPAAILISAHPDEDPQLQIAEEAEALVQAQKIIVFCRSQACESSKVIAKLILESGLHTEVKTLHGGEAALKSVGLLVPAE